MFEELTMSRREKKFRQTYPGPNALENQQMLQDMKQTLENHQKKEAQAPSVEQANKKPSPPMEPPTSSSPSVTSRAPAARLTPTKQLTSSETQQKLAQIRQSIKLYGPRANASPSDAWNQTARDRVNRRMLEELVLLGYSENWAIDALIDCNSASIEKALEILRRRQTDKKKLTAIQEDTDDFVRMSPSDYESRLGRRSEDKTPTPEDFEKTQDGGSRGGWRQGSPEKPKTDMACQYDAADISRMSPIALPGFSTPINFVDPPPFRPTPVKPQFEPASSRHNDDPSPTRNSPMILPCSPPPYTEINNIHAHISPPPEVQPQSYSPFSAPFSSCRSTPVGHGQQAAGTTNGGTPIDLVDSGIEEEAPPRRTPVPPEAFKFFMEQHMETIMKAHAQRQQRRLKLETEMAKRQLDEATSEQMRRILYAKESEFLRLKRAKMSRDMFKVVKPLGIGAFGVVSLVKKVDTNKLYAMKTLRKADVLRRNQVAHVKAERDILAEADNEWVVKLFFSFQDEENLYFVMEYIAGGDMMSLLIRLGTFPEHLTLFYIAELVCAIESVHKMGFIHRDIKPDNILIGADGHIKLTDFGLCTGFRWTHESRRYQPNGGAHNRQPSMEPIPCDDCTCCDISTRDLKPLELRKMRERHRCTAHSLVGTPNYIATEILRREAYTQLCDWWSVGVIMYEMMVGQPPFMASTPAETQYKIINWHQHLHIPQTPNMSPAASDLIRNLCCDPQDRIGRNGAGEIKHHVFFSAVDWSLGIRNYEPPYLPKIMHEADTSNFDPIPQNMLQKMARRQQDDPVPQGHPSHAFYEFTFIRFYHEKVSKDRKPTLSASSVYSGPIQQNRASGSPPKERAPTAPSSQPVYV